MNRPPDSRAQPGQALEDEADAITDTVRRDVATWVAKLMRGHPNNPRHRASIVAGLTAGALDVIWDATGGDLEMTRNVFNANVDGYLEAMADDRTLDAEPVAEPPAKARRGRAKGRADA